MAAGREIDDTEPHRIAELFLVFIIISLLFGRLMKFLESHLHGTARRGLRHTVHHIEEELLALGVISLLLIVSEDYLLRICVHNDDYNSENKSNSSYSGNEDNYHRKLLAGDSANEDCSASDEPFWSAQTIHQTHIFIFLIAIVHVLYATTSFLLCLWRIYRWKRFEENQSLISETLKSNPMKFGRNAFEYWFWSFWAQFSPSVDAALFGTMRFLFIERMELPEKFNFHAFLLDTMVEDFAIVVHADWQMWVVAAIWILVPRLLLVTTVLSVCIVLLVGTKLELVGVMLSQQYYLSRTDRNDGPIKTQPIIDPISLLKKPIERFSLKLGRNSVVQRTSGDRRPQLATQSMNLHTQTDSEIPLNVIRRAHSFQENDFSLKDVPLVDPPLAEVTPSLHRPEVGMSLDSEKDEISPDPEQVDYESDKEDAPMGKPTKICAPNNWFPDSATFFWFGRPRLILRALQFVYFETAMAIALVFFDLWQSSDFILEDTALLGNDYLLVVILIVVGVLCLLQTSFLMLPTYVLTSVAGSHCPERVLAKAKKLNIKQAEVSKIEYLRNKSVLSRLDTLNKMPVYTETHDHEKGHNSATAVLVGAMYEGKMERLQKQEESQRYDPASTSEETHRNPSGQTAEIIEEEDEEMEAIVEAFGSFESFLNSIKTSQNLIKATWPKASFNFDCTTGSYEGKQSTSFDLAAINLTLDINAAMQPIQKLTHE
eukprot:g8711.t1